MSLNDKIRNGIRNYLGITEPNGLSINIMQLLDFEAETFKNKLWMRGEGNELEEFYKSVDALRGNKHFWGAQASKGERIRKIHTGLPSLIVDKLTDVCTDDLLNVKVSDKQEEWDSIAKENNFKELISECVSAVLSLGDGAFKFSYDSELSSLPIIEFFPADRVDFEYNRGRLQTVIFKTEKVIKKKKYTLKEHYTKNDITYTLEDADGRTVSLDSFEDFKGLQPIENKAQFLPAVPVMFYKSKMFPGRGRSIFTGKYDNYDSFDEIVSQLMLAVRKGQIKTYIPDIFLMRDAKTGEIKNFNDFDSNYIAVGTNMSEGAENKISTTQGEIQHEALIAAYSTTLDLCLQGIISPATLGIDIKKLDNAEAQREKEKTTLYTRNKVVNAMQEVIQDVVLTALRFNANLSGKSLEGDIKVTVNFGGYANPSFEAQVETVGKARQYEIMSTEAAVEELYGDDKEEEWKEKEIRRIKEEKGIIEMPEPAVNTDNPSPFGFVGNDE